MRSKGKQYTEKKPNSFRVARIERKTRETEVKLQLNLDGRGDYRIRTSVPFLDHMLALFCKHGFFDLKIDASGDTEIDLHHTVEDIGICLGKSVKEALGEKKGITRYGSCFLPMDEALAFVAIDISSRPYMVFNVPLPKAKVGNFDVELLKDFFRAFVNNSGVTLHIVLHYGENLHHISEAIFKAFGRALSKAASFHEKVRGIPSTKGEL